MKRWLTGIAKAAFLSAATAIVTVWFRNRAEEIVDEPSPGSAQWPPLEPLASADGPPETAPDVITEPSDGAPAEPLADHEPAATATWVAPNPDGSCPAGHPVKAKDRSGLYHVEGGLAYERTNADRCYATPAAAEADGYRASRA